MKKATILTILVVLVTFLTTGCGEDTYDLKVKINSQNKEIEKLTAEVERLTEENNRLSEENTKSAQLASTANFSSESTIAEENCVANNSDTDIVNLSTQAEVIIPTPQEIVIPREKEAIHISVLHRNGISGSATAYLTADQAVNHAFKITDFKTNNHKYVDFVISGVTVSRVELVQGGKFEEKTDVTFDKSLNQYTFEKCYSNYGRHLFLVTTCHGNQYYFAATF